MARDPKFIDQRPPVDLTDEELHRRVEQISPKALRGLREMPFTGALALATVLEDVLVLVRRGGGS